MDHSRLHQQTYDKHQGKASDVRIEVEYKLNEAGAKQFINDEIKKIESLVNQKASSYLIQLHASRLYGHLQVLSCFGLLSIFDFHQFKCELGELLINSIMMQLYIEPQI